MATWDRYAAAFLATVNAEERLEVLRPRRGEVPLSPSGTALHLRRVALWEVLRASTLQPLEAELREAREAYAEEMEVIGGG